MNVLSYFDGMSCGQLALRRAGIKVDNYFACEIKEHAIAITQENFPHTIQLGDVTKVLEQQKDLSKIDLYIGGSPCQDLSGANKERKGLEGIKSKLFYTYLDTLNAIREANPDVKFLLENVSMKKDQQDLISELVGCQPIRINSKLVSGQLRNRLYWTNIEFDNVIEDRNVSLQSILTEGYTDRDKARCLLESDSRPSATPVKMFHRYYSTGFTTLIFKSKEHYESCVDHYDSNFKSMSAKDIDGVMGDMDLSMYDGLRYMNKTELEACQTVPEGYTDSLTRNNAACLLGDGWTVDVIAHIFKNL